ncbi:acyltransferase [Stieleria sp. JC731]|uniref:acyltransferase n=1 Tax=Pirellulaceae TaxID=2691357 RepID=UPI001E2AA3FF|nr:acyltransferase [Stieleria sp. JC731]MCC9599941.1 acyltransferase [Stieleria sp. JC731]
MRFVRLILRFALLVLPWAIRRPILEKLFGYRIAPTARIRLSWVYPKTLVMDEHSRIGPFVVAINLDRVEIGSHSSIGRRNWITGFPTGTSSQHFADQADRRSELIIGRHSAITKNHHLDCTSSIVIGDFVTIAGYQSQLLTHSVDIHVCRQASHPIQIGNYCFIGTKTVILGGASLPDYSVLGACSLLNKPFDKTFTLYAGVPARAVKDLPQESKYFSRDVGFIV